MAKSKSSRKILESSTSGRKHLQNPAIVEPQNRRDLSKVKTQRPFMEIEVYNVIDMLRGGRDIESITQELRQKINPRTQRKYAPRFVENIITTANQLVGMWYRNQIYKLEHVHIQRYNQIIINQLNKSFDHISKPFLAIKLESMALDNVLQAMKQKETLIGMHRKTFRLIFNEQVNFFNDQKTEQPKNTSKEKRAVLNLDLLSFEEKVELLELIRISAMTDDEMYGVILRQKKAEEETEDVEAEIIPPANVAQIEQYRQPDKVAEEQGSILDDIQRKLIAKSQEIISGT